MLTLPLPPPPYLNVTDHRRDLDPIEGQHHGCRRAVVVPDRDGGFAGSGAFSFFPCSHVAVRFLCPFVGSGKSVKRLVVEYTD
jgi:hypothetical protein